MSSLPQSGHYVAQLITGTTSPRFAHLQKGKDGAATTPADESGTVPQPPTEEMEQASLDEASKAQQQS